MSDTISCPQCSSPLPAGAVFCTGCGYRLEADAAPKAATAPPVPEDATRVDTPGLNDATQSFAPPEAAPPTSSSSPSGGAYGAASAVPGAPWQPADAGSPGPAAWNPPPQAPRAQPGAQPWQQPQPGGPQPGGPQQGGAPQGWAPPAQGAPSWDTTGTAPTGGSESAASPLGGIVALVGGLLTLAGIFTAWFKVSSGSVSDTITGWELTSGDKGLDSKDPYILLALGIVAIAIGVVFFMGQKRMILRVAAVVVGIAIVGITLNDWMTTASLFEKEFDKSVELSGAIGFYLTIVGGIVTAVAAALPAKK